MGDQYPDCSIALQDYTVLQHNMGAIVWQSCKQQQRRQLDRFQPIYKSSNVRKPEYMWVTQHNTKIVEGWWICGVEITSPPVTLHGGIRATLIFLLGTDLCQCDTQF